jgi:hypothetical protein
MPEHFVSASCRGERCQMCVANDATHKVGEELLDGAPEEYYYRHNLTAYVCCPCFMSIMRTRCG